ncbi:hypothetical protein ACP4OV_001719 [Aristida adscensionis]
MAAAASSSKLLALTLSSSFLRSCRLAPAPSRRLAGPLPSPRFCSSAAAAVDVADSAVAAAFAGHPWPEWGDFLEKLRSKGYFEQAAPPAGVGAAGDGDAAAAGNAVASSDTYPTRDLNRLKNACLKFARERHDLLSALPKQDIRAIVERGCPNIFRKAVNSAKRLREFVQVEESDACSSCKLRGSCDKANLTPQAEDATRTVDVVRILLTYAIEPANLSGENSVDGGVQESARKLLSELVTLSDTAIDPSLPKPVLQTSRKQESSTKQFNKSRDSGAKAWGSVGKGRETSVTEMKQGDWLCPNCNFLNFARNRHCLECKADGPKKVEAATTEMKTGDWICEQCHFMNFSRNKICFKCEEPRPKRQLNPGEWECPSCLYLNFRRNKLCKKCNNERAEDDTQDNRLGRRKSKGAERSFDFVQEEDNDSDGSPYKESRKPVAARWKTTSKSRRFDNEDGLLTAKGRSVEEHEDDDVLPYEGVRKHVASKRATPSQRRFTAARNQ